MPTNPGPMMDQETSDALRTLIRKGKMGAGVFEPPISTDVRRTQGQRRRVFAAATERFYGIEALMKDNSGNWFSLTHKRSTNGEHGSERNFEPGMRIVRDWTVAWRRESAQVLTETVGPGR